MSGPILIRLGGESYRKTADLLPEPDPKSNGRATARRKTQLQQDVLDLEGKVEELKRQLQRLRYDEENLRTTILTKQEKLRVLDIRVAEAKQGLQLVKDEVINPTLTKRGLTVGLDLDIPSIDPEDEYTPPKRPKKARKRGPVKDKRQAGLPSKSAPFVDNPYVVDLESPAKAPDVLVDQEK